MPGLFVTESQRNLHILADHNDRYFSRLNLLGVYVSETTSQVPTFYHWVMKLAGLLGYGSAFVLGTATLWMANASHHVNPEIDPASTLKSRLTPPVKVAEMLQRSCNDCHSNETKWPWYSRIPLLRSQIKDDVHNARETMNFSEWPAPANKQAALLLASCSAVRQGMMPPSRYVLLHPGSRPSKADVDHYCAWASGVARAVMADQISRKTNGMKTDQVTEWLPSGN